MADTKLVDLTAASAVQATDLFYADDGINDVKVTAAQIKVFTSASPTFVTPALGTPSAGNLVNCTGYTLANLASIGANVATFLATPSSANLIAAVTDETGSGALVFGTSPVFTTDITLPNTGLHILDTNASHDLIIKPGSDITADRTLTLTTGNTDMIVDLTAVTDEYVLAYDTGTNTWRGVVAAGGSSTITANTTATSGYTAGQFVYSDGSVVQAANFYQSTADIIEQRRTTNAQTFRVYNTYTDASNYERGTFDWSTTSNTLTIGAQAAGTGVIRDVNIVATKDIYVDVRGGGSINFRAGLGTVATIGGSGSAFIAPTGSTILLGQGGTNHHPYIIDHGGGGSVAVMSIGNTSAGDVDGWIQWAGEKRVTSNFDTGNTTTLANITGLSVNVAAGRTYSFTANLYTTSNIAAGVKFAIAGTATATDIVYEAVVIDSNVNAAQTRATALAGTVGAVTAVTVALCKITGTITVNAAGTLTVQMAQNVGNATGSVALRGSSFIVFDMP